MAALDDIANLVSAHTSQPPLEKWHPELSGDIDIVIGSDGRWFHEGDEIKRQELVKLFSSILRREEDGCYYLVTPVEKWRLVVEDLPFNVVDMEVSDDPIPAIAVKTNTGQWFELSAEHPLTVTTSADQEPQPEVTTLRGMGARVNRPCFYRLVDLASEEGRELVLHCRGGRFSLGKL